MTAIPRQYHAYPGTVSCERSYQAGLALYGGTKLNDDQIELYRAYSDTNLIILSYIEHALL